MNINVQMILGFLNLIRKVDFVNLFFTLLILALIIEISKLVLYYNLLIKNDSKLASLLSYMNSKKEKDYDKFKGVIMFSYNSNDISFVIDFKLNSYIKISYYNINNDKFIPVINAKNNFRINKKSFKTLKLLKLFFKLLNNNFSYNEDEENSLRYNDIGIIGVWSNSLDPKDSSVVKYFYFLDEEYK